MFVLILINAFGGIASGNVGNVVRLASGLPPRVERRVAHDHLPAPLAEGVQIGLGVREWNVRHARQQWRRRRRWRSTQAVLFRVFCADPVAMFVLILINAFGGVASGNVGNVVRLASGLPPRVERRVAHDHLPAPLAEGVQVGLGVREWNVRHARRKWRQRRWRRERRRRGLVWRHRRRERRWEWWRSPTVLRVRRAGDAPLRRFGLAGEEEVAARGARLSRQGGDLVLRVQLGRACVGRGGWQGA